MAKDTMMVMVMVMVMVMNLPSRVRVVQMV
jgi:hypothetical protein